MAKTFIVTATSGGAGTSTDQLAGTPIEFAGTTGRVRAGFISTLTTTTASLRGASGMDVIPAGCKPNVVGPLTAQQGDVNAFVFDSFVKPGEKLFLDVVRAGTETWSILIRLD